MNNHMCVHFHMHLSKYFHSVDKASHEVGARKWIHSSGIIQALQNQAEAQIIWSREPDNN